MTWIKGIGLLNVRFGLLADICSAKSHVRFAPESGHVQCTGQCLLCANSGRCERHGSTKNPRAFQRFARGFPGHIL